MLAPTFGEHGPSGRFESWLARHTETRTETPPSSARFEPHTGAGTVTVPPEGSGDAYTSASGTAGRLRIGSDTERFVAHPDWAC
jgi:hypothetical protein